MALPGVFQMKRMTARDRRIVSLVALGAGALVLLGTPLGVEVVVRAQQGQSDDLRQALADVQEARGRLQEQHTRKDAIALRYGKKAPPLAGYLEQTARQQKLEVTES